MKFLTLEGFAKLVRPFKIRISNLISRGVVKRTDDSPGVQELQAELLTDEVRDELEHMQHFGFASHPDDGAECLVVFPGGDRSMGFVIATADRRYRVKVEKGEVAIYDKTGSRVLLKKTGDIELVPSSGIVKVTGDIEATGDVRAGAISLKTHVHPAPAPSGYTVSAPGGAGFATGTSGAPQ
jgi:phage gp45-like